ncbi:MAG TPA: hypothetical protein VJ921_00520 [Vicinamibacteria bacterium]|nr:hypothetical protein [Vicinamibacteria bacterium]
MNPRWRLRAVGTAYLAFSLAIAIAALATHVLGQKMLDSLVQVMGVFVVP